jgi:predicted HicB family RNase H-like nuclease
MTLRLDWSVRKAVENEASEKGVSVNDLINLVLAKRYKLVVEPRGGTRRTEA